MKKILLILGVVVAAVLLSGGLFLVGSGGDVEPVINPDTSVAAEMMQMAEFFQKQGRYDAAYSQLRQLLDLPLTSGQQRDATRQLGEAFLEDYRKNGASVLDSADLYLRSAFGASLDDVDFQLKVGKNLMYIASEKNEAERFFDLAERLLSLELEDDDALGLWQRKFDYIFESGLPWSEIQREMIAAENLSLYGPSGVRMLDEARLRINERLLTDSDWFAQYAEAMGDQGTVKLQRELFNDVSRMLAEQMALSSGEERGDYALRLGIAMVSTGDFEGAKLNLRLCLETSPSADITLALQLIFNLFGERGDEVELQQFVTQLLHGRTYYEMDLDQKLRIVGLLSSLNRYSDALDVIEIDLKMIEPGPDAERLLAEAVILEARQGNNEAARELMDKLFAMGVSVPFGRALKAFVDLQMARNEYALVLEWGLGYLSGVPIDSAPAKEILFSLAEASYWLDKPVVEKICAGAIAVQASPNDQRVAPVILRMAGFVEEMGLHSLAGTYYNRIGLLNFFQEDGENEQLGRNIGELAMLGKARCLKQAEEWERADHLFRDLSRRTVSPLIRSEIAVHWAELSFRFGQRREAERRYNLADPQLLSPSLRARYFLGQARLHSEDMAQDGPAIENALIRLQDLSDDERGQATVDFFNETFDFLFSKEDDRAMSRLIDLAYQSDYAAIIPIQSYVLRKLFQDMSLENIGELNEDFRETVFPKEASMVDLAQAVRRIDKLRATVSLHSKRSVEDE